MKEWKCMVVDDEPLAIDVVVNYLGRLGIAGITRCDNGIDAFRELQKQHVDLLFLDIQMPQFTGFELLKSLPARPAVVITSAYRDFAVEGFDWEVLDYLVKPFSFPRFLQAIDKVARRIERPDDTIPLDEKGFLFLKTDRQWVRVEIAVILYVESLKDYIRVATTTKDYICHRSLSDITTQLPTEKFLRVHRSFTVALDKIEMIKDHYALIGSKTIPIARANRADIYRRLGEIRGNS